MLVLIRLPTKQSGFLYVYFLGNAHVYNNAYVHDFVNLFKTILPPLHRFLPNCLKHCHHWTWPSVVNLLFSKLILILFRNILNNFLSQKLSKKEVFFSAKRANSTKYSQYQAENFVSTI